MGSPLYPTLANIFLCHRETVWLKTCANLSNQCIIKDTFITPLCCMKNRNEFYNFLIYMNKRHKNITSSLETEKRKLLLFS